MILMNMLKRGFSGLASVTLAIPLLVLIAAATILGTAIPQGRNVALASSMPEWVRGLNATLQLNDIFHSWWYLSLLALLGLSLLAITIKRVPVVWQQRGRGIAVGILLAHIGVLIFLGGAIYSGSSGFRYYTQLIEGDVKVLPALPFVIKFDRFDLEYYPAVVSADGATGPRIARRQESTLTLFKHGSVFQQIKTAPGKPVQVRGVTLLPDQSNIGWAFSLVLRYPNDREKVISILPWAPELISLGVSKQRLLAHKVTYSEAAQGETDEVVKPDQVEVFLLDQESGESRSLGFTSEAAPLIVNGYTVTPWNIRPYTGMHIYQRQGMPLVISGIVCLMAGLLITLFLGRRTLASTSTKAGISSDKGMHPDD
jgi:cytochrome c biogenesis protein ResB